MTYQIVDAETQVTLTQVPVYCYNEARHALHVAALMAVRFAKGGRSVLLLGGAQARLYRSSAARSPLVACVECEEWTPPHNSQMCPRCQDLLSPSPPRSRRTSRATAARPRRKATPAAEQLELPEL